MGKSILSDWFIMHMRILYSLVTIVCGTDDWSDQSNSFQVDQLMDRSASDVQGLKSSVAETAFDGATAGQGSRRRRHRRRRVKNTPKCPWPGYHPLFPRSCWCYWDRGKPQSKKCKLGTSPLTSNAT